MTRINSHLTPDTRPRPHGWTTAHDAAVASDLPNPTIPFVIEQDYCEPSRLRAWPHQHAGLIAVEIEDEGDQDAVLGHSSRLLTPDEARDLAAWLLAAAHHIDTERTDQ